MRLLEKWLKEEPQGLRCFTLIIWFFIVCFLYSAFVAEPILKWGLGQKEISEINTRLVHFFSDLFSQSFFYGAVFIALAAFFEEVFFRFLPVVIFRFFSGKVWVLFCAAIISSLAFGYAHYGQFISIFAQGVIGFLWFMLYLKCGGFYGGRGHLKALVVTSFSHFAFNMMIISTLLFSHPSF